MAEHILRSFGSPCWSDDPELTREMRTIFNQCMKPGKQNRDIFGKNLVFDENANLITRVMSEHILRSFGNDPWDADPVLT